jgi:hypothetical protein
MTNAAMRAVLTPLYKCSNYDGSCRDHCRWEPEHGLVPCGFGGATGPLDAVRLVLVTAEPGDTQRRRLLNSGDDVSWHTAVVRRAKPERPLNLQEQSPGSNVP